MGDGTWGIHMDFSSNPSESCYCVGGGGWGAMVIISIGRSGMSADF